MTFQNDLHIHYLLLHMIVAPAVNINQTINKILLLYLYGRFLKKYPLQPRPKMFHMHFLTTVSQKWKKLMLQIDNVCTNDCTNLLQKLKPATYLEIELIF